MSVTSITRQNINKPIGPTGEKQINKIRNNWNINSINYQTRKKPEKNKLNIIKTIIPDNEKPNMNNIKCRIELKHTSKVMDPILFRGTYLLFHLYFPYWNCSSCKFTRLCSVVKLKLLILYIIIANYTLRPSL